jgi:2-dehydro-3-deoxyphosphogluconate aldolase / (4S)-4-hydroxy-2-oxoglutarate aldolase
VGPRAAATLGALGRAGVLAIVRLDSAEQLLRVAEAVRAGGVTALEFTLTTPGALEALRQSAARLGDGMLLGAGTVLDATAARAAISAGAQLVVCPILSAEVAEVCREQDVLCLPAGMTPTELQAAWALGTGLVKLFPASVGGPSYVREVLAPLPHLRLAPTGGVNADTAAEFIRAGAFALGVGSALVDRRLVASGDFAALTERARRLSDVVGSAR